MDTATFLPILLGLAWLLPLASFALIVLVGPRMGRAGVMASYVATGAILGSLVASVVALGIWVFSSPAEASGPRGEHGAVASAPHEATAGGHAGEAKEHAGDHASAAEHQAQAGPPRHYTGDWYTLGRFGALAITVSYYIDALTIGMFAMVTAIATCIHFYSIGYMHDELDEVVDHEVTLSDGRHLHRPGRFHRFFQYMSLFSFSMLGLVVAGNVAMVFVFWELVGICSYFLIGFYIERKSATNAANKAFIVNRIGDFGMIVGMMALWASLGTFAFGDVDGRQGIFSQVRSAENGYRLEAPAGMVRASAAELAAEVVRDHPRNPAAAESEILARVVSWREQGHGYWLLVVAGIGIFCGCVGKSAQFPLHVWLPDAMEGPTPVSALVHSATMVAAGVYLVGRFYPVFAPEVLLVIAVIGAITLLLAASIAITAVDIKRVLAYSTVSQLGYMMLALGLGGWAAGLFHLITHAFFKSLLFLCSGSVIHACHTNDITRMGGLRKIMPWTAYTMLVGCLAIIGAPLFSGFFSKDAIIAQALSFWNLNPTPGGVLFAVAAGGAAVTAFYMFRLWFMTFTGEPRDRHVHEHAHESPPIMYVPLVVLAVFAVAVGWPWLGVVSLLEQARPAGELGQGLLLPGLVYPDEHASHAADVHLLATLVASATALGGFLLAVLFYGVRLLDPAEARQQFRPLYNLLWNKWHFDELYQVLFVRPVHLAAGAVAAFDKGVIDGLIHGSARWTRRLADFDDLIDRYLVDQSVNVFAAWTWSLGNSLRSVQTGRLRQYVMLIVIGTVALTVLINFASAR